MKKSAIKVKTPKKTKPEIVPFERFAAIDFETADYGRDSACAIAIVVAEKGAIIKKAYSLIKPPRKSFEFSWLHGISWKDVANKPTFKELWPEVQTLFEGVDFIAAHNASFDRGVLHACCDMSGHSAPQHQYVCTMKLSRRLWDIRPTKLSDVCNHFGFSLDHHNAQSDALACAKIVLEAKEAGVPSGAFLKQISAAR